MKGPCGCNLDMCELTTRVSNKCVLIKLCRVVVVVVVFVAAVVAVVAVAVKFKKRCEIWISLTGVVVVVQAAKVGTLKCNTGNKF